jgi:hypothetical protein
MKGNPHPLFPDNLLFKHFLLFSHKKNGEFMITDRRECECLICQTICKLQH